MPTLAATEPCWRSSPPCAPARALLHGRSGAALLAELSVPRSCGDLCARVGELTEDTVRTFLAILAGLGIIGEAGNDGDLVEDADPVLAQWEFHDLLFHSRSRLVGMTTPWAAPIAFWEGGASAGREDGGLHASHTAPHT